MDKKKYIESLGKLTRKIKDDQEIRESVAEKYCSRENQLKIKFGDVEFYGNISAMAYHSNFIAQCFTNCDDSKDDEIKSIHLFEELKVDDIELVNFAHLFRLMNGIDLPRDFKKLSYFDKMKMWKYICYFNLQYDSAIIESYIKHMVEYNIFDRQIIYCLYLHPDANQFLNFFKKLQSNFDLSCFPMELISETAWDNMHMDIDNAVTNFNQLCWLIKIKQLISAFSRPEERDPAVKIHTFRGAWIEWSTISSIDIQSTIKKLFPLEDKKMIAYKDVKIDDYVCSKNDENIEYRGIITGIYDWGISVNRNADLIIMRIDKCCTVHQIDMPKIYFYR